MKALIKFLTLLIPLGASGQFIKETESNWGRSGYKQRFVGSTIVTDGQIFLADGLKLSLNMMDNDRPVHGYSSDIGYSVYLTVWADALGTANDSVLFESSQGALGPESDWVAFAPISMGTRLDHIEQTVVFLDASNQLVGVFGNAKTSEVTGELYRDDRLLNLKNDSNLEAMFESSWNTNPVSE